MEDRALWCWGGALCGRAKPLGGVARLRACCRGLRRGCSMRASQAPRWGGSTAGVLPRPPTWCRKDAERALAMVARGGLCVCSVDGVKKAVRRTGCLLWC